MKPDVAAARAFIEAGNVAWGRARVSLDRNGFERMLARDFFVVLPQQRLSRQEFIDRISRFPAGATLTRFDTTVLTVRPEGNAWAAVILEKLEYQRRAADGSVEIEYVLAVTRDGWRNEGDRWVVLFSELIGDERWGAGQRPPFPDW